MVYTIIVYNGHFLVTDNYPSIGYPCNPIALGQRWIAFSETKVHMYNVGIIFCHLGNNKKIEYLVFRHCDLNMDLHKVYIITLYVYYSLVKLLS